MTFDSLKSDCWMASISAWTAWLISAAALGESFGELALGLVNGLNPRGSEPDLTIGLVSGLAYSGDFAFLGGDLLNSCLFEAGFAGDLDSSNPSMRVETTLGSSALSLSVVQSCREDCCAASFLRLVFSGAMMSWSSMMSVTSSSFNQSSSGACFTGSFAMFGVFILFRNFTDTDCRFQFKSCCDLSTWSIWLSSMNRVAYSYCCRLFRTSLES